MMTRKNQINLLTSNSDDIYQYAHITVMPMDKTYLETYGLIEIEEEVILKLWMQYSNAEQNDYQAAIDKAKFIRRAGLTPVYYSNQIGSLLYITSSEFISGKFH